MEILKFKTNVENAGELKELASFLDNEERISKWNIDTDTEQNILSVSGENLTPDAIIKPFQEAGFEAELIRVVAIGGNDL